MKQAQQGPRIVIRLCAEAFDPAQEEREILATGADIGALVAFTGLCRSEAGAVAALELEHYPGMAEREIAKIARRAVTRWPLLALTVLHRYGRLRPGEKIVLVLAAAKGRAEAFAAAEFVMDYLKSRAPFWKRALLADGSDGGWIEAKTIDEGALARWEDRASNDEAAPRREDMHEPSVQGGRGDRHDEGDER
jgi:molybdopterin synthase catalytic subunit